MIAEGKLAAAASRACTIANIPADQAQAALVMLTDVGGHDRRLSRQPALVLRAAAALMHAALSHCLMHPPGKAPKSLHWAGRRWYLRIWSNGVLHVSPMQGNGAGLVSGYGELIEQEP
jgi:hypothetical protein